MTSHRTPTRLLTLDAHGELEELRVTDSGCGGELVWTSERRADGNPVATAWELVEGTTDEWADVDTDRTARSA